MTPSQLATDHGELRKTLDEFNERLSTALQDRDHARADLAQAQQHNAALELSLRAAHESIGDLLARQSSPATSAVSKKGISKGTQAEVKSEPAKAAAAAPTKTITKAAPAGAQRARIITRLNAADRSTSEEKQHIAALEAALNEATELLHATEMELASTEERHERKHAELTRSVRDLEVCIRFRFPK